MAGWVWYRRLMYVNVAAAASNSPLWNWDLPIRIHALQSMGLYSLRLSHSMSRSVFFLFLSHTGRLLMECSFMAFSHFSMARS